MAFEDKGHRRWEERQAIEDSFNNGGEEYVAEKRKRGRPRKEILTDDQDNGRKRSKKDKRSVDSTPVIDRETQERFDRLPIEKKREIERLIYKWADQDETDNQIINSVKNTINILEQSPALPPVADTSPTTRVPTQSNEVINRRDQEPELPITEADENDINVGLGATGPDEDSMGYWKEELEKQSAETSADPEYSYTFESLLETDLKDKFENLNAFDQAQVVKVINDAISAEVSKTSLLRFLEPYFANEAKAQAANLLDQLDKRFPPTTPAATSVADGLLTGTTIEDRRDPEPELPITEADENDINVGLGATGPDEDSMGYWQEELEKKEEKEKTTEPERFALPQDYQRRFDLLPEDQKPVLERIINGYLGLKSTPEEVLKVIDPLLPPAPPVETPGFNIERNALDEDISPNPEPEFETPASSPATAGQVAHKVLLDMTMIDGTVNVLKNANEQSKLFMREAIQKGNGLWPPNWGRKIGLKSLEPLWRLKVADQLQKAALDNNTPLATLDLGQSKITLGDALRLVNPFSKDRKIKNLIIDTESLREDAELEEKAVVEDLKRQQLYGRDALIPRAPVKFNEAILETVIKPFATKGELTHEDKKDIQSKLTKIVEDNIENDIISKFFGKKSNEYRVNANHFATDIEATIKMLQDNFQRHNNGVENLDEWLAHIDAELDIKLQKAHWGAETEAHFERIDKMLAAARSGKHTVLANSVAFGALASVGTWGFIKATGYGASHALAAVPGVGAVTTFGLSFARNLSESKARESEYKIKKAYGEKVDNKEYKALADNEFAESATELLDGEEGIYKIINGGYDFNNPDALEALATKTAEIDTRLYFSRYAKNDLVSFSSRATVARERIALEKSIREAASLLRTFGYQQDKYKAKRTEWLNRFARKLDKQEEEALKARLSKALWSAGITSLTSLVGGYALKEALDHIGINPFEIAKETTKRMPVVKNLWVERKIDTGGIHLEADQNNNVTISANGTTLLDQGATLSPDGSIIAPKDLLTPEQVGLLQEAGFKTMQGPRIDITTLSHHEPTFTVPVESGQDIRSTIIPPHTRWEHDGNGLNLVADNGKVLARDVKFDGDKITYEAVGKIAASVDTQTESITQPAESLREVWDRNSTEIIDRHWHSGGSAHVTNAVFTTDGDERGVVFDLSKIAGNRDDKAVAITLPGREQNPIIITDASDGVIDGQITFDPSDNINHVFEDDDMSLTNAELSRMILNQEELKKFQEGPLGSEMYQRQNVFNLSVDGKAGHIEAGYIKQDPDGQRHLEVFATATGTGDAQAGITNINRATHTYKFAWDEEIKQPSETITLTPLSLPGEEPEVAVTTSQTPIIPFSPIEVVMNPFTRGVNKKSQKDASTQPDPLQASATLPPLFREAAQENLDQSASPATITNPTEMAAENVDQLDTAAPEQPPFVTIGPPPTIPPPEEPPAIEELEISDDLREEFVRDSDVEEVLPPIPEPESSQAEALQAASPAPNSDLFETSTQIGEGAQDEASATNNAPPTQPRGENVMPSVINVSPPEVGAPESQEAEEPIADQSAAQPEIDRATTPVTFENSQGTAESTQEIVRSSVKQTLDKLGLSDPTSRLPYLDPDIVAPKIIEIAGKIPGQSPERLAAIFSDALATANRLEQKGLLQNPSDSFVKSQTTKFVNNFFGDYLDDPIKKNNLINAITNTINEFPQLETYTAYAKLPDRNAAFETIGLAISSFMPQPELETAPPPEEPVIPSPFEATTLVEPVAPPEEAEELPQEAPSEIAPAQEQDSVAAPFALPSNEDAAQTPEELATFENSEPISSAPLSEDETERIAQETTASSGSRLAPPLLTRMLAERFVSRVYKDQETRRDASEFLAVAIANSEYINDLVQGSTQQRRDDILLTILASGFEATRSKKKERQGLFNKITSFPTAIRKGQQDTAPSQEENKGRSTYSRRAVLKGAAIGVGALGAAALGATSKSPSEVKPIVSSEINTLPSYRNVTGPSQSVSEITEQFMAENASPPESALRPPTWSAKENVPFDENGMVQVWPAQDIDGTVNLNLKNEKGEWEIYNNIVPVAKTPLSSKPVSTEMDNVKPERTVVDGPDGTKIAQYQYPRLSNGAHFSLLVTLSADKNETKVSLVINDDSAPIESFTPGNFLGMADMVQHINTGVGRFDATIMPMPHDGPKIEGKWSELISIGKEGVVKFLGDRFIQTQELTGATGSLAYEVRRHAWMEDQRPARDENWFEAVQIIVLNPPKEGATWTFRVGGRDSTQTEGQTSLNSSVKISDASNTQEQKRFEDNINQITDSVVKNLVRKEFKENATFAIPLIARALKTEGIYTPEVLAYSLATLESENGFEARKEIDGEKQAIRLNYEGQNYYGRGYIQLTGVRNHKIIGDYLGLDLVNNPDLLLDPNISARAFAAYFRIFGTANLVNKGDLINARYTLNMKEKNHPDPRFSNNPQIIAERYRQYLAKIKQP